MDTLTTLDAGYRAIVIGATGGIGAGFVRCLEKDPRCADIATLSRSTDGLDMTDEASIADHAARLHGREFQLILCATGALTIDGTGPEKTIRSIDPAAMARQFALNAIGPALILKHFAPLLARRKRALFALLSARVGSISDNRLGGWISYRASKAALNQIVCTSAIEIARSRPDAVVAALHPGTVETGLSSSYSPAHAVLQPDESAASMLSVLDRLQPPDSGGFFAYDGTRIAW
ncbi:MAG: SDR family NAD(P)-dependent oxidoreductase [Rhizobium sp.]|nr:SDR family NAD(P)-dependent oxidoreductase [Rhizobium sp.]